MFSVHVLLKAVQADAQAPDAVIPATRSEYVNGTAAQPQHPAPSRILELLLLLGLLLGLLHGDTGVQQ